MIAITTRSSTRVKAVLEILLSLHRLPPPPYFNISFPHGKNGSEEYGKTIKQIFNEHKHSSILS
jgi:hypothetical protein